MLATITGVLGGTTTFSYVGASAQLASVVAPGGQETDFGYDSSSRSSTQKV